MIEHVNTSLYINHKPPKFPVLESGHAANIIKELVRYLGYLTAMLKFTINVLIT